MTNLSELARPSGGLAMVAMDQRESLRAMFAAQSGAPVPDEHLTGFKLAVAGELGPSASGFLIDRTYGFDTVVDDKVLPESCGLILAADTLVHPPGGGPVVYTELDERISAPVVRGRGVAAMKLLIVWRRDDRRTERLAMAAEFVARCADAGLLSILEGVVRREPGVDFDEMTVEAATELGGLRPSLYKCPVPRFGEGDPVGVAKICERITAVLPVPWVVLSQGVSIVDFPGAVRTACNSGASGFLAGRALWSDTLTDPHRLLRDRSIDRLKRLADLVDATARPWQDAA